ncbi:SIR2 family protein [Nonomuraea sp. NPDC049269]|uniref:SIR2 family protein n=1 Tax=Nonomuraea sp. NPDC049269 TaxID=3364349 RepID=UPI0037145A30
MAFVPQKISLEEIVRMLQADKEEYSKPPLTVLFGAGCSSSAGVLSSAEIVRLIRANYAPYIDKWTPDPSSNAPSTYEQYMDRLDRDRRAIIVREAVAAGMNNGRSKLNWAHLALAWLQQAGYIRLSLTTNFDHLIADAYALVGEPVRTFDLATASTYPPIDHTANRAFAYGTIVHLHGQEPLLHLVNTRREGAGLDRRYKELWNDALSGSNLLVVGYSGKSDRVIRALTALDKAKGSTIFWVTHEYAPITGNALQLARKCEKFKLVEGYEADSFMALLVTEGLRLPTIEPLKLPPQQFLRTQLERVITEPYPAWSRPMADDDPARFNDPVVEIIGLLSKQIDKWYRDQERSAGMDLLMAGFGRDRPEIDAAFESWAEDREDPGILRSALRNAIRATVSTGKLNDAQHFRELLRQLIASPSSAYDLVDCMDLAESSLAIFGLQRAKNREQAERELEDAENYLLRALTLDPDHRDALLKLGVAIGERARLVSRRDASAAEALYVDAERRLRHALDLNPEDPVILHNLGLVSGERALMISERDPEAADALYRDAERSLADSLSRRPNHPGTLFDLACLSALKDPINRAVERVIDWWMHDPRDAEAKKSAIEADVTFDRIRDEPEFVEMLEQLSVA